MELKFKNETMRQSCKLREKPSIMIDGEFHHQVEYTIIKAGQIIKRTHAYPEDVFNSMFYYDNATTP